jgi:hypothetical protein
VMSNCPKKYIDSNNNTERQNRKLMESDHGTEKDLRDQLLKIITYL